MLAVLEARKVVWKKQKTQKMLISRRMSLPTEVDSKPVTVLKDEYKMVKSWELGALRVFSSYLISQMENVMPSSTRRLGTMMISGVPGLKLP